jgi:hypothetical protein
VCDGVISFGLSVGTVVVVLFSKLSVSFSGVLCFSIVFDMIGCGCPCADSSGYDYREFGIVFKPLEGGFDFSDCEIYLDDVPDSSVYYLVQRNGGTFGFVPVELKKGTEGSSSPNCNVEYKVSDSAGAEDMQTVMDLTKLLNVRVAGLRARVSEDEYVTLLDSAEVRRLTDLLSSIGTAKFGSHNLAQPDMDCCSG